MNALARAAQGLDIQPEAFLRVPRIVMSGGARVLIEGHRGLLEYEPERIAVAAAGCRILIKGAGLDLVAMDGDALVVSGQVWAVELE